MPRRMHERSRADEIPRAGRDTTTATCGHGTVDPVHVNVHVNLVHEVLGRSALPRLLGHCIPRSTAQRRPRPCHTTPKIYQNPVVCNTTNIQRNTTQCNTSKLPQCLSAPIHRVGSQASADVSGALSGQLQLHKFIRALLVVKESVSFDGSFVGRGRARIPGCLHLTEVMPASVLHV